MDDPVPELLELMAESASHDDALAARHKDNRLQTAHDRVRLEVRLRNTMRHAASSIEEQGVNILYLALGMLEWYESDSSEIARTAPLVPCRRAVAFERPGALQGCGGPAKRSAPTCLLRPSSERTSRSGRRCSRTAKS